MPVSTQEKFYVLPASIVRLGVATLVASLVINGVATVAFTLWTSNDPRSFYFSNEKTPALLPMQPRTVALEVVDSERYGMHDDNDWASVTPLGHGFVKVGDGEDDFYAISMYHQIHCLNGFRKVLNGHRNDSRAEHDAMHNLHCLSYMRQVVLCNADLALEPAFLAKNTDGRLTQAAYGVGVTHQCRDWEQVRSFAEENFQLWKGGTTGFAASEISAQLLG